MREIFAPRIVGVPPSNAVGNVVELPDGSLRCYALGHERTAETATDGGTLYLESRDHGLTWTRGSQPDHPGIPLARSPVSGDFIGVQARLLPENGDPATACAFRVELTVFCSRAGVEGPFETAAVAPEGHNRETRFVGVRPRLFDVLIGDPIRTGIQFPRPPIWIRGGARMLVLGESFAEMMTGLPRRTPLLLLSDDDGRSWKVIAVPTIAPHPISWPDKGMRNEQSVCEPTIAERADGSLWMLLRTATDNLYEAFSEDGGETWTTPVPSAFFSHKTMPTFHRLTDGRLLLFWSNTAIFPEDHRELTDKDFRHTKKGRFTHGFTNRDVLHAAISADDGKTWAGFRELILSPAINAPNYALGEDASVLGDKSVHQSQALNLPEGKVLAAVGQHPECRRLVVFDPDWLLETECADDFGRGLDAWSTFLCVKGVKGFCAYDRRPGAVLVPHPDRPGRSALRVRRVPDATLLSDVQGAVWNFPAALSGAFEARLRVEPGSRGGLISLLDRWVNPSDRLAHRLAMYNLTILENGRCGYFVLQPGVWHTLRFEWAELERGSCRLAVDGEQVGELRLIRPSVFGISYVLFQSVDDAADEAGFLVESVRANKVSEGESYGDHSTTHP